MVRASKPAQVGGGGHLHLGDVLTAPELPESRVEGLVEEVAVVESVPRGSIANGDSLFSLGTKLTATSARR